MSIKISEIDLNNLPPTLTKAQARAIMKRSWDEFNRLFENGVIPTIPGDGKTWIPTHRFLVKMEIRSENSEVAKELSALRAEIAELKSKIRA